MRHPGCTRHPLIQDLVFQTCFSVVLSFLFIIFSTIDHHFMDILWIFFQKPCIVSVLLHLLYPHIQEGAVETPDPWNIKNSFVESQFSLGTFSTEEETTSSSVSQLYSHQLNNFGFLDCEKGFLTLCVSPFVSSGIPRTIGEYLTSLFFTFLILYGLRGKNEGQEICLRVQSYSFGN